MRNALVPTAMRIIEIRANRSRFLWEFKTPRFHCVRPVRTPAPLPGENPVCVFEIRCSDATTLVGVGFSAGVRHAQLGSGDEHGRDLEEMRPVLTACLASGLGLLPAATSSGIGPRPKQPLASIVVGGMATTIFAVLFVLPVFAPRPLGTHFTHSGAAPEAGELRIA